MVKKINLKGRVVSDNDSKFYEYFGMDCISPKSVIDELKGEEEIELIINSPGGSVIDASEIYTALMEFEGKITAKIVGFAASAASWIAMAADTVKMSPTALMMIHNSSSWAAGDHREMESTGSMLSLIDESIRGTYLRKTGLENEKLRELMDAETWFNARTAKENNLVDEIMFGEEEKPLNPQDIFNSMMPSKELIANFYNKANPEDKKETGEVKNMGEEKVKNSVEAKPLNVTKEYLLENHKDIYREIFNEGIKNERERIKAIEDVAIPGMDELVNKAKFETGENAEALAVNMIKEQKNQGHKFMANLEDDKKNVNLETEPENVGSKKEQQEESILSIVNAANKGVK